MEIGGEKRRHPRRKAFASQREFTLQTNEGAGEELLAKLLDIGKGGVSVQVSRSFERGSLLSLKGDLEDLRGRYALHRLCKVRSCRAGTNGHFIVGLSFEQEDGEAPPTSSSVNDAFADHYETLQLSRNADFDTIQRVFRILAQRYHPDNKDTGNERLFLQVVEAHKVLSDPERRTAYDLQWRSQNAVRMKLFDSWTDAQGPESERRIRKGILAILYRQRQRDPRRPDVSLIDLAEVLDVPREHLDFSLWFLRESKFISRADNGKLEITVQGVLSLEASEDQASSNARERLAIEAPEPVSAR